eukprot:CAMPEP_0170477826 /NCGR_PEP_ID=MMETSP0123-20130129/18994_1 /TAXON_ID=182087 /ORGANISM="Favella ehrenbergii, Strain Fehren 1" /LENGTH=41 /DNA_ID= /DNA_START= /DNA_END= /DNA_ORIENTATION=
MTAMPRSVRLDIIHATASLNSAVWLPRLSIREDAPGDGTMV